jgi:hypothetical protein
MVGPYDAQLKFHPPSSMLRRIKKTCVFALSQICNVAPPFVGSKSGGQLCGEAVD